MEMNYILGSNVKVHVDIQDHMILDSNPIPVKLENRTAPTSGTITVLLKGVGA